MNCHSCGQHLVMYLYYFQPSQQPELTQSKTQEHPKRLFPAKYLSGEANITH